MSKSEKNMSEQIYYWNPNVIVFYETVLWALNCKMNKIKYAEQIPFHIAKKASVLLINESSFAKIENAVVNFLYRLGNSEDVETKENWYKKQRHIQKLNPHEI